MIDRGVKLLDIALLLMLLTDGLMTVIYKK
mgnify:CR=1 FL=1